ncbi:MAG: hypothetical protein V1914_00350 [archaeon]
MKQIYPKNSDRSLEPVISKEELKEGLSKKVSKLIENATEKVGLESNSKNRPYDLSSAGPYPDY